jgi:hypothetical protein
MTLGGFGGKGEDDVKWMTRVVEEKVDLIDLNLRMLSYFAYLLGLRSRRISFPSMRQVFPTPESETEAWGRCGHRRHLNFNMR